MLNTNHAFTGQYQFLSNMAPCTIVYEGFTYHSLENAYQAAKLENPEERFHFVNISPYQAKKLGRTVKIREDWDEVKIPIMYLLLRQKFFQEPFRRQLLETEALALVEYNYWHDNFWGSCTCARCRNQGANHLGELLMTVRSELQAEVL
jgi:ribA/ribD-fused uncharacterized protein